MVDVDIFVSNPTNIDWDVYQLWLRGFTGYEAAHMQQKSGVLEQYGATPDDLRSEIMDYYRLFNKLEFYLKNPCKMPEQQVFIMDADTKRMAIHFYYQFDDEVVREFLGKKLSTRNRKDLDDVCEKVRVRLRNCRRQFDNMKHVFKEVDETPGCLVTNIQKQMCITRPLAERYAAVVFIASLTFETSKKKVAYLTCDDFMHCSTQMLQNWASTGTDEAGLELEREFVHQLRDLRPLSERELVDEHKLLALKCLRPKVTDRIYNESDAIFKSFSKVIIAIACNLNHSKDVRDLFVDIVEKIIDPVQHLHWTASDITAFLDAYRESATKLDYMTQSDLLGIWERYIKTFNSCVVKMYHA